MGDVLVEREMMIKKDIKVATVREGNQGRVVVDSVVKIGSIFGEGLWTND